VQGCYLRVERSAQERAQERHPVLRDFVFLLLYAATFVFHFAVFIVTLAL
jgi:hypothetical protein